MLQSLFSVRGRTDSHLPSLFSSAEPRGRLRTEANASARLEMPLRETKGCLIESFPATTVFTLR